MSDGISLKELKEILADQAQQNAAQLKEVIAELRKPTETEKIELDAKAKKLQAEQEERKENSAAIVAQMENRRYLQRNICTHKHKDGHSHCVYVNENGRGPGYILCQKNQCKIRAGVAPEGYNGDDIYDLRLFNQLMQELPSNELFN